LQKQLKQHRKNLLKHKKTKLHQQIIITVGKVEIIPVAKPAITLVPAPVDDFCTIANTGFVPNPV
jgi:hypothetical protein